MYHGDISLGDTIDVKFTTVDTSDVPATLAGTPVVSAYVDNGTTEITAGITLTVDFDARTGLHNVRVVASSGNGFAAATNVALVITTGTVGGTSRVGLVVGSFSISARSALRPTTPGRTLDVATTGEAEADVVKWLGTAAATPTVAGVPEVDLTHVLGGAVPAVSVTGTPKVDVGAIDGTASVATTLRRALSTMLVATVSGSPTTTSIPASDLPAGLDNDDLKGRIVAFAGNTTAAIQAQASDITVYNGTTKTLTVSPLTRAPAVGDILVVL